MSEIAIKVRGLRKRYQIGGQLGYKTLRESVMDMILAPVYRLKALARGMRGGRSSEHGNEKPYIWALDGVSFEIGRGEVVGIIGRNGAGKSTLLKILSRITEPTEGSSTLHGRVGSLLEVGTGFHPELTGRENVFLNGAIMGMQKAEIARKFDEIVDFAGVEKFIDTPVKRYSSGMYVRLAFAVAAHLEPEILLVDEVLSVGDIQFQRKCLSKMGQVASEGRTVLFISHNMGAINQFCPRCIWLDAGRVAQSGETASVVNAYLKAMDASEATARAVFEEDLEKDAQLRSVRILNEQGEPTRSFSCDHSVLIELTLQVHRQTSGLYGLLQISSSDGTAVLVSYSFDHAPNRLDDLPAGVHKVVLSVPPRTLGHGDYRVHFSMGAGLTSTRIVDDCGVVCTFSLDDLSTTKGNRRLGFFSTLLNWDVEKVGADRDLEELPE